MLEWDAEWSGPQVIVEVSERATNANTTHIEGKLEQSKRCSCSCS